MGPKATYAPHVPLRTQPHRHTWTGTKGHAQARTAQHPRPPQESNRHRAYQLALGTRAIGIATPSLVLRHAEQIENTRAVEDCSVGIRRSASSAPLPRALPRTARSRLSSIINSTYSHTTNLCHHHRFPTLCPTSIDPKDVTGWIHRVNEGSLMWAVGASSATNLR